MNGYEVMAKTYRKLAERGEISKEESEKQCKVYDFLASCDKEDIYNLFDSSAFNEIAKEYMRLAVKELVSEGAIDEDQGKAVRNRFSLLFDEKQSKEVCECGVEFTDEAAKEQQKSKQIKKENEAEI